MVVWRQFATGSIIEILNRKKPRLLKHQLTLPPSPHLLDCRNGNESPWSGWIMERGTRRVERRRRHRPQPRKTEAKEEPTETTATVAPPDNIPFWKSDFSAVLAIFAAFFLPSFLPSSPLLPSFSFPSSRSYVRSISSPALRSNPSDPTYSKAAASACLCLPPSAIIVIQFRRRIN